MHEAQMHSASCFVTLTYRDEDLPVNNSLDYRHFQLFMKRLRRAIRTPVRFYMCGEYGEQGSRPHFHACLFGVDFEDKILFKELSSGFNLYTSPRLDALWPHGFASIGDVTFESAAYVARYVMKKVTGNRAAAHYSRLDSLTGELISLTPEFTRMSLKPGIGANWIRRFRNDVYTTDAVIVRGVACKPPRYYDRFLESVDPFAFEYLGYLRSLKASAGVEDTTPERLAAREKVAAARLVFKKRTLS